MRDEINNLISTHYLIMLYVANNKIYWLRKHYRYLHKREMLKDKVLIGSNTLKLKEGFKYLTEIIR